MTQKFVAVRKGLICFHMVLMLFISSVGAEERNSNHQRNENMGRLRGAFRIVVPESTCECKTTENSYMAGANSQALHLDARQWQVDKFLRRPYEMVTVLWRKTKIFDDVAETTPLIISDKINKFKRQDSQYRSHVQNKTPGRYQSSEINNPSALFLTQVQKLPTKYTISNIEFDYIENINDRSAVDISKTSGRHLLFKEEPQTYYSEQSIFKNKFMTSLKTPFTTLSAVTSRQKRSRQYKDNNSRDFQFLNLKFMGQAFPYKFSYEAKVMPVQNRRNVNKSPISAVIKTTKDESNLFQDYYFKQLKRKPQSPSNTYQSTPFITKSISTLLAPLLISRLQGPMKSTPQKTFSSTTQRCETTSHITDTRRPELSLNSDENEFLNLFFTLDRPTLRPANDNVDVVFESFTAVQNKPMSTEIYYPENVTPASVFFTLFSIETKTPETSKTKRMTSKYVTTQPTITEQFNSDIVNIETSSTKQIATTQTKRTEYPKTNRKQNSGYDRIKFFEIYDEYTERSFDNATQISLENVNNENETKLERLAKIDKRANDEDINIDYLANIIENKSKIFRNKGPSSERTTETDEDIASYYTSRFSETKPTILKFTYLRTKARIVLKSNKVDWKQFPFAAAYIHEPSKVHCDAAALSSHWLTTSGSCLYRHHKSANPSLDGLSAFVSYCGSNWRDPEHITYVKYSAVHPKYHPRDEARRRLYNIGLIQVVNSMSMTCSGWSPISLMTHQFASDVSGSPAYAIGWGLDRHNEKTILNAKGHLTHYEGIIYTDSCPGSKEYKNLRRLPQQGGINNVYCMSLPPYRGENEDPIHGGLLFVGSKLVALYLQEERRFSGEQCAQYTGVWRLIPWVLKIAREPDDNVFYKK